MRQIPRFKTALFCILIAALSFQSLAEPSVVIDSLAGKAEVQRAGKPQWSYIAKGSKIFNNDLIRVQPKGFAKLKFPDGSVVLVREGSQILVNLHQNSSGKASLNHATVFFGAVFFVVTKTLPRAFTESGATKIYTPTAVVSLRGTSFEVFVSKENGATNISVINGTVLVRNIIKNVSIFLGAPYQTTVEMNTDPIVPRAVLQKDIDTLKTWVPPELINLEIATQLAQAKRDQHALSGKFQDKLIVLPFTNVSSYAGNWHMEKSIPVWIAAKLKHANKQVNVITIDTTADDPRMLARSQKARFVLTGIIEVFDVAQHAEITVRADEYREFNIARVRVKIQLIDAAEDKFIGEDTFLCEVSGANKAENTWREIGKLPFDLKNELFSASIMGKAVSQLLEQTSEKLVKYLQL